MQVKVDPKLASNIYKKIAEQPKAKDGNFGDLIKGMIDGVVEQSKAAETTALSQTQNSISSGDFASTSLNIKDLDMNLKAILALRDGVVKALDQLQQMPM